jgi:hypothetical protein
MIRFVSPNYFEAIFEEEPIGFAQFLHEKKLWMVNYTAKSEIYHVKTVQEAVDIFSDYNAVDFQ